MQLQVRPGKWLQKQKQEIRYGVEKRKEPGEAIREPKIYRDTQRHTWICTHTHTHKTHVHLQRGSEVGGGEVKTG